MSVTDPNNIRPLKVAGPGSVRINSRQRDLNYEGFGWVEKSGFYDQGYARETAGWGERVTIKYRCQFTHDLYVGTEIKGSGSSVTVTLDSDTPTSLNTQLAIDPPIIAVRRVRTNVPAGAHELALTCDGNGIFTFDHIEAAVPSDVPDPAQLLTDVSMATDWDTDATYKLPAERLLWQLDRSGLIGDLNHFVGNFFHYNRRKRANTGARSQATVTFGGTWNSGEAVILSLGGIYVGKSVFPGDDSVSIAAHMEAFINGTFVGVFAERTDATITIKNRANLYGFELSVNANTSFTGTVGISGSLAKGSEGIWEIDDTASPLLNHAATVWHQDFFSRLNGRGRTTTVAYNLEAYNPPESASAHWAARYYSGRQVLTDVGFGSEGDAKIISASNSAPIQIQANKHGFSSGDRVVISGVTGNTAANGSFVITIISPDVFSLDSSDGTASGAYVYDPIGNDFARRTLKTTHLAPNPVVATFLKSVYAETADLMATAGLPVKLQFGENLWWFFSDSPTDISSVSATAPIRVTTTVPHSYLTGDTVILAGIYTPVVALGTHQITVVNSTTFDINGTDGTGSTVSLAPTARVVGGSMAFYDIDTTSDATTVLGRPLVRFTSQDSDPTINASADADFLRDRLATHLESIVTHVRTTHTNAIFELLYPFDVLYPTTYHTANLPYPQGGRLNHHVSTPPTWNSPADTNRRLKIEALSWGAFFRHGDLAEEAMALWQGLNSFDWPREQVAYLIPWFNGGTPWRREFLDARRINPSEIHFWALDHYRLLEWPQLPRPIRKSGFFGR